MADKQRVTFTSDATGTVTSKPLDPPLAGTIAAIARRHGAAVTITPAR